jgi:hypothetical protein
MRFSLRTLTTGPKVHVTHLVETRPKRGKRRVHFCATNIHNLLVHSKHGLISRENASKSSERDFSAHFLPNIDNWGRVRSEPDMLEASYIPFTR